MARGAATDVRLRIEVESPPRFASDSTLEYGVQDKHGALHSGTEQESGGLVFELAVAATRGTGDIVDVAGPFVHGRPGERFLYLGLRDRQAPAAWIKRWKIPLGSLTWALIEESRTAGRCLAARITGNGSGTVPLIGNGWMIDSVSPDGSIPGDRLGEM